MTQFRYTAVDSGGRSLTGAIDADSRESALEILARQQKLVVELNADAGSSAQERWWERELLQRSTLSPTELGTLARELATLSAAHIPTDEMLSLMASQTRLGGSARQLIAGVRQRVLDGSSLSDAMAASNKVPEYFWRLVRAGETAGSLQIVLRNLADHLQASVRMRGQLMSALLYPAFLLVTALMALAVIGAVTAPAIAPLFRERGMAPPFALRMLVDARQAVIDGWPLLAAGIIAVMMLLLAARRSAVLGRIASGLVLKLPLVGQIVTDAQTARFARMLEILIGNRVPVLDAIRAAEGGLTNARWRSTLQEVRSRLNEGSTISRPLAEAGVVPDLAVRLIAAGERSGQLPQMLGNVADIYEQSLGQRLERLTTLLAPILTLVIGCLIGGLMLTLIGSLLAVNELGVR